MISGEFIGEAALAKKLSQAGKRAEERVRKRARALGEEIADRMRSRVAVDTGTLRDSIRVEDDEDGNGVIVRAGGGETTGDIGSRRYDRGIAVGTGDNGRGRKKKVNGETVAFDYALGVEYGTAKMPAQPFFNPVANIYRKKIIAEMAEAAVEAAVEEME